MSTNVDCSSKDRMLHVLDIFLPEDLEVTLKDFQALDKRGCRGWCSSLAKGCRIPGAGPLCCARTSLMRGKRTSMKLCTRRARPNLMPTSRLALWSTTMPTSLTCSFAFVRCFYSPSTSSSFSMLSATPVAPAQGDGTISCSPVATLAVMCRRLDNRYHHMLPVLPSRFEPQDPGSFDALPFAG